MYISGICRSMLWIELTPLSADLTAQMSRTNGPFIHHAERNQSLTFLARLFHEELARYQLMTRDSQKKGLQSTLPFRVN